jgi:hypothetical protein
MKKLSLAVLAAASLTFLATACGSSSDSGPGTGGGSCTVTSSGATVCIEFASGYPGGPQQACTSEGGSWSGSGCSSSSRVGRCTVGTGTGAYTVSFYPPIDATTGPQACQFMGGTWTAG